MKTLKQLLSPRKSVFDKSRRDVVLDVTDLIEDKIDPENFFSENYITKGMGLLYKSVFNRLEGKSDDGIFRLTQSMGGGKTHNLITIGLLAKYPEYRDRVMGDLYKTSFKGSVKVIGFSGRENPRFGIWGYIAEQLGKKEAFNEYYSPLQAPGQSAWINLLKGEKVLILLDELPPYFQAAKAREIGDSNLAEVTTQAVANLLVAAGKAELKNVAIIITDLAANYEEGSSYINKALDNLKDETNRLAKNFTPVEQSGDEIYNILRTRLFESLPSKEEIDAIADAYASKIKEAKQMDITTETPESFSKAVKESYPFHPAIKDLFARFKENPGFQQTRGLIRFMRTNVARMFDEKAGWANKNYLVTPHDIDLSDSDTLNEIGAINSKLLNAISHDISGNGNAVAEQLDSKFGNHLASNTAKLILISSLATVQNSVRGLKDTEIIRNLCAPGVDIAKVSSEVLPELKNNSWYLHIDNTGSFLFKDVQNVVAKLNDYIKGYNQESIRQEIKDKLEELFKPIMNDCYQKVYAIPALDEIEVEPNKVILVIYPPHSGEIHPELRQLYHDTQYQNRLLFLTGDNFGLSAIYENAAGLKAIEAIKAEFIAESMNTKDPQFIEAEKIKERFQFNFKNAIEQTFVKLFYPTKRGLLDATLRLEFHANNYNGEDQIKETLKEKRKFTEDVTSDTFQKYVEGKLFQQKSEPWSDIKKRASTNPDWVWHKPNALDQLKISLAQKGLWRENGDWVEKGPFVPAKTSIAIREISRNDNTGEVTLKVVPTHGDKVYWEVGKKVTTGSSLLDSNETFSTTDLLLSFLCVDSIGAHETGEPVIYQNRLTLKHRFFQDGNRLMLELQAAPDTAVIRYSTNGTDPFDAGGTYDEPFEVKPKQIVQAVAEKHGIRSEIKQLRAPDGERGPYEPDRLKPAKWKKRVKIDSTAECYEWLKLAEKHNIESSGLTIAVNGIQWISLDFESKIKYNSTKLALILDFMKKELVSEGELSITASELHFESGQRLLDYVKDTHDQIKDTNEVEQ